MSHVLVICARRYNGHELWTALGVLRERGHTFLLASTAHLIEDEITGQANTTPHLIEDALLFPTADFSGMLVVSGNLADTKAYWQDSRVLTLISRFNEANLPIGGICCSVPTLRYAAAGKRVTYFPLLESRELLSRAGAILTPVTIVRDANLVTSEHQMGTQMWAEEFCNMLEGKPPQHSFSDSGWQPKGRERMPIPEIEDLREKLGRPRIPIRKPKKGTPSNG